MGTRILPSGRLSVRSMPLTFLINYAYVDGPGKGLVDGGPAWARSDGYDIEAKIDDSQMADWEKLNDSQRRARVRAMLRTLLGERFHLKLHAEMRVTQVYALVQAKGGTKLKQVEAPELQGDGDASQKIMRFMAEHPGEVAPGSIRCADNTCTGRAIEMKTAINQIGGSAGADRIMVDETGLKGLYDFSYTISRDADAPTPMQQIEDQLGLRFESRKIPIETYVIDSAEKPVQD